MTCCPNCGNPGEPGHHWLPAAMMYVCIRRDATGRIIGDAPPPTEGES